MSAPWKVIRYLSTSSAYSLFVIRKKQSQSTTNDERRTTNQAGFTLIELMVTIAIIAILSAVGVVVYSSAQKTGRISKRVQDLKAIQTALELYKSAVGTYPLQSGSWACVELMSGTSALAPTYMPVIPKDPLDSGSAVTNCYQYQSDASGNEYKIRTNPTIASVASGPEMSSTQFAQQNALIDPARDSGSDVCKIEPAAGTISGWALYSGSTACGY